MSPSTAASASSPRSQAASSTPPPCSSESGTPAKKSSPGDARSLRIRPSRSIKTIGRREVHQPWPGYPPNETITLSLYGFFDSFTYRQESLEILQWPH